MKNLNQKSFTTPQGKSSASKAATSRWSALRPFGSAAVQAPLERQEAAQAPLALSREALVESAIHPPPKRGIPFLQLGEFYHQFGIMIESGVPIQQALRSLQRTGPRGMRPTIAQLIERVSQGEPLNQAMARLSNRFSWLDYQTLAIAETSGTLDKGMFSLGKYYESLGKARRQIISASILPALILIAAVFVTHLPAFILGNLSLEGFLGHTLGFLTGLAAALWLAGKGWKMASGVPYLSLWLEAFLRMIPVVGRLKFDYALTRWIQSIRLLLNAGYGVLDAMRFATPMVGNPLITRAYAQARPHMNSQMDVSQALGLSRILPDLVLQFWSTGEQSGRMDEMLDKLAQRYQEEWERSLAVFSAWLPRIIYGLVALYVIMQVFNLLGPIFAQYREALAM